MLEQPQESIQGMAVATILAIELGNRKRGAPAAHAKSPFEEPDMPPRRILLRLLFATTLTWPCPRLSQSLAAGSKPTVPSWLKPPALRRGDTVMLVAPAGVADKEKVAHCVRQLEKRGFTVRIPKSLYRKDGYLAGTDEERADELNAAIRDPKVRAIFPCRGGYGLTRILDHIDYSALRKDPKIIIGFSDITALHLAVAAKARVVTFHSPMPQSALWRADGDHAFSASSFWRVIAAEGNKGRGKAGFAIELPKGHAKPKALVGGKATGRLVGGNLTLICATLGTPYAIAVKGNILLLEDTGEAPYRIDRMLSQLRLAGALSNAAGIILGTFDKTDPREVERIMRHYCGKLKIPVLQGFPIGHTALNVTLPHGGLVEIDADTTQVRLVEAPVELK
jgi:muramoyltetrapeptide carboxypeptidase